MRDNDYGSRDKEIDSELKELKRDDTRQYEKVPFKLYWDNDIREDRKDCWT